MIIYYPLCFNEVCINFENISNDIYKEVNEGYVNK